VAALDHAQSNIRVNAVCPGIIDTPMMQRFTGDTPEGRARVIAQEPIGRMGTRGTRRDRPLAVFGCRLLRLRTRHGRGRWSDGAVTAGADAPGTVVARKQRDSGKSTTQGSGKPMFAPGIATSDTRESG
jgi:NAD(P)-dependent dehydrogenase (short-subunit alcohol dehydrogenase family)